MVYFKAEQNLFDKISGLGCYCNGSSCTPYHLFDEVYSGLDDLIKFNRMEIKKSFNINYVPDPAINELRDEKYSQWLKKIPEELYIKVQLGQHQGVPQYKKLKVLPRTNFSAQKDRRPNIVYLQDEMQNTLIMRLAKTYLPGKKREDRYTFNRMIREHFPKIDLNNLFDWVEHGNLKEHKKNSYQYVPEPFLTVGLEEMYKDGFPRITPNVKTVYQDEKSLVTIRPMLMLAWDHSLWKGMQEQVGDFLGNLYGINLLEKADRQVSHYAVQKPKNKETTFVVNYDPDFFVRHNFTNTTVNQITKEDFGDFKKTLKKKGENEDVIVPESVFNAIYDRAMERMNSDELKHFKKDFLDFFPSTLNKARVPNPVKSL